MQPGKTHYLAFIGGEADTNRYIRYYRDLWRRIPSGPSSSDSEGYPTPAEASTPGVPTPQQQDISITSPSPITSADTPSESNVSNPPIIATRTAHSEQDQQSEASTGATIEPKIGSTTTQDREAEDEDILPRIRNMFRLLELYSEQGSAGLVEKVLISQDSVCDLIEALSPGRYPSMTNASLVTLYTWQY